MATKVRARQRIAVRFFPDADATIFRPWQAYGSFLEIANRRDSLPRRHRIAERGHALASDPDLCVKTESGEPDGGFETR